MSYRLVIEPDAEMDIGAAAAWYEQENPRSAIIFLNAVDDALHRILQNPFQYQVIHRNLRRANVKRFPYGIMYAITQNQITVIACWHGRRAPNAWQDRIP